VRCAGLRAAQLVTIPGAGDFQVRMGVLAQMCAFCIVICVLYALTNLLHFCKSSSSATHCKLQQREAPKVDLHVYF
jgi:hypothetical protein